MQSIFCIKTIFIFLTLLLYEDFISNQILIGKIVFTQTFKLDCACCSTRESKNSITVFNMLSYISASNVKYSAMIKIKRVQYYSNERFYLLMKKKKETFFFLNELCEEKGRINTEKIKKKNYFSLFLQWIN